MIGNLDKKICKAIQLDDKRVAELGHEVFEFPIYDPSTHYLELTRSPYYFALGILRHYIQLSSHYYWGQLLCAKNIDLFMLTPSVSSPMGSGSDSEAIPIKFGDLSTYLVDSSQFGFEPLLLNNFDAVYCYLPSMRGETPDKRHLNQFFHCEAEIIGELDELIPKIESYIKFLAETILLMPMITDRISLNSSVTKETLDNLLDLEKFEEITFDEAVKYLQKEGHGKYIKNTDQGRDITGDGERVLGKILGINMPFWIKNYDRDRAPFYQKPHPLNKESVINADLIFPPLIDGAFGGEVVGSGQRQDSSEEIYESLLRQKISSESYEWYISLRNFPGYQTTSGFGIGVERFITWALCRSDIKEAIFYPRLKNILTYP